MIPSDGSGGGGLGAEPHSLENMVAILLRTESHAGLHDISTQSNRNHGQEQTREDRAQQERE